MAPRPIVGAATTDITPNDSQFLFGYPHVRRYSTGVHDALWSSAFFLADGRVPILLVANDVIFISRQTAGRVRDRIEAETGISEAALSGADLREIVAHWVRLAPTHWPTR